MESVGKFNSGRIWPFTIILNHGRLDICTIYWRLYQIDYRTSCAWLAVHILRDFTHWCSAVSAEAPDHGPTPIEEQANPELAKYLNRSYWESVQANESTEPVRPASPSAPATAPVQNNDTKYKVKENGVGDNDLEEFIQTLKSQVEIFINRMKSNSSRGRCV